MKLRSKLALLNLLCFTVFPAAADNATGLYNQQQMSNNLDNLIQYLQNWGQYIGYDITQAPGSTIKNFNLSQNLINLTSTQLAQVSLFYTFLGSIPVNSFNSNAFAQFVPTEISSSGVLNPYANATFQNYNTPGQSNTTGISINPLIDQTGQSDQTGQQTTSQISDPISQAVLNILGTPDFSYCMTYDGTALNLKCHYLTQIVVSDNVIGKLPDATTFFSYNYIQNFISQLNSNSLISPLMYTTQSTQGTGGAGGAGGTQGAGQQAGLTAQSQVQQAANFIRYASGAVVPIQLPNWRQYDTLFAQATAPSNSTTVTPIQQQQAQGVLSRYLATLRTYAAQNSVGLSNLYYIMSKRIPQTPKQPLTNSVQIPSSPPSSQALSEFNMATWRLFNPATATGQPGQPGQGQTGQPGNTQWISQINNASSATVEKEIAMLLAEINYQMYLDRQLMERILLTNSILLLQSAHNVQPTANFGMAQP